MRVALIAIAAIGCSFSGAPTPGGVDTDGSVTDASVPIDGATDGTPPDGPPTDVDGDGVPNPIDNCPTRPNSNQANEDGDSFGNACDLCPAIDDGATQQADDDVDNIGNGCDPQPNLINSLVFFEGFDGPLAANDWTGEEAWNHNAALGVMERNNMARAHLARRNVGGDDKILVVAEMQFTNEIADNQGQNYRYGGVYVEANDNADTNHGCWIVRARNNEEFIAWIRSTNGGVLSANTVSVNAAEGVRYRFSQRLDGSQYNCSVSDGIGQANTTHNEDTNSNDDDVGVVASYVEAQVFYLYAIRLQ